MKKITYNDILNNSSDKVGLRMFFQPAGVERVRINPQTVEYLVEDVYGGLW